MSNEMNLPWSTEVFNGFNSYVVDADKYPVTPVVMGSKLAAHIVRCVNAHDGLVEALQKLACLGNGDRYGNSDGNCIAQAALAAAQGDQDGTR